MQEATLGDFLAKKTRGITPNKTPSERFELYSVPAFDHRQPEIVSGAEIGSNKQIVEEGTVLLCKINPRINRAWVVGSVSRHQKIASTEWIAFPPRPELEPRYLAHFLSQAKIRDYLAANASGVGGSLMRVKASTVEDLTLPVPGLEEQHRIVAEIEKQFSRLDGAVANLKRVATRLHTYRTLVLEEAFAVEAITTLGALVVEGPQNGLYLPKSHYGDGIPILRIDDFQFNWLRSTGDLRRVRASEEQVRIWGLKAGDLLINRVNSVSHLGKAMVVPPPMAGVVFESNMMRMRLIDGALPRFVELYLGSMTGRRRLTANAKWAVNQASINQQDVCATPVPLPPYEEQRRIAAEVDRRFSIVREVVAEVDANVARAQALRQAVLARAFSGKV